MGPLPLDSETSRVRRHAELSRRAATALACVAALSLVCVPSAAAHALLLRSTPAANAILTSSPSVIVCTFTEPPDPRLSQLQVVDAHDRPVAGLSRLLPVPGRPSELEVRLSRPLAKGVYTVNWLTTSAVDGHVTGGAFAFGIGTVVPSSRPPLAALGRASAAVTAAAIAGKWALDVGLMLLLGAATTTWVVFRDKDGWLGAGGHLLLRLSWVLAFVGIAAMLEAERVAVGLSSLLPLFGTEAGRPLVAVGCAVIAVGLVLAVCELWPSRWTLTAVGLMAAVALFLHAYGGHADSPSSLRALNLFVQWLHLMAVGVWVGGLVWLLLGLRGQQHDERARAVRRFSWLAGYAIAVVAVTGVQRAVSEVGALHALVSTRFGVALLVKVGLFLVLAALGALNRYRSLPVLVGGNQRRFRWNSRAELLVAVGILGLTGYLSGLAPANYVAAAAAPPSHQLVVSGVDYGLTVRVRLTVSPGIVGANTFVAQISDYSSARAAAAQTVQLLFSLPAHPTVGASSLVLKRAADGSWRGRGLELSVAGDWSCEVLVQQAANAVVVPLTIEAALP